MVTTTRRVTLEDLERDGGPEGTWEVIDGELIEMAAAGGKHGWIGLQIGRLIGNYVVEHRLGYAFAAETGFVLNEAPLLVRAPDVSYVRNDRLPANFDDGGFLRVSPDLAVEVLSPSDRSADALAKVVSWLEYGVVLVWLVDPKAETVTIFGPKPSPRVLSIDQILDGDDVLPGFTLPVRDIFAQ